VIYRRFVASNATVQNLDSMRSVLKILP